MFKWLFKKKGCAKHMNNKLEVIGIDHGWSMMKTISQVFVTGVKEITTTPALFGDVLEYEGKFYKVGTVRQEVKDTKVEDDSFYLLTLAAVAKELKRRGLAEAKVFLAVGLPLTRFGAEKNDFIKYLTKNKRVKKLPGATFKVTAGADIYKADGTKVYSAGDVVAESLTTGADGQVVLSDLHLGTYVVTEIKSIDGYTINTTPQTVAVEYKDQTVTVQYESTTIENTRQKADVSVVKKDSDTENPLDGGKYTLYAGNDIKNYAGQVIVTKGRIDGGIYYDRL